MSSSAVKSLIKATSVQRKSSKPGMKILFVTKEFSDKSAGGAGVYAYELTKAMAAAGAEVHVMAAGDGSSTQFLDQNLIVHWHKTSRLPLLATPTHHVQVWAKSKRLIKKLAITTVHSNNFDGAYVSSSVPIMVTIHHPAREEINHAPRLAKLLYYPDLHFEKRILRKAALITTVSHLTKEMLQKQLPEQHITVVPIGTNLDSFKSVASSVSALRKKLDMRKGEVLFFFPGGVRAKRKGALTLFKALQSTEAKNYKIAISGESRELGWQREFNAAMQRSPAKERFIMLGEIDYAELPAYYSACDVVLYPSTLEGFGLPALEALACGKPIIATRTGEMPYIIINKHNGLLIDVSNETQLSDAFTALLSSANERKRLAINTRQSVQNYSWKTTAHKVLGLHAKLMKQKI